MMSMMRVKTVLPLLVALALLVTASVSLGTAGTTSAQQPVHEADGSWHRADGGPVRFKVSPKRDIHVRWRNWLADPGYLSCDNVPDGQNGEELGCVADGEEPDPLPAVARWEVTATPTGGTAVVKTPKHRSAHFRDVDLTKDYAVVVEGFDGDNDSLGSQEVTIRPRHVSEPDPPTAIVGTANADGQELVVKWNAPTGGGKPLHYNVIATNIETGRVTSDRFHVKRGRVRGKVTLTGLWPGDTYRVAVSTTAHNSRYVEDEHPENDQWQHSGWAIAVSTVTLPTASTPSYSKVEPTLIWERVEAGEADPPYVVGTSTTYIVNGPTSYGYGPTRFDAPNECLNWKLDEVEYDGSVTDRYGNTIDVTKWRRGALPANYVFFGNHASSSSLKDAAYQARKAADGQHRFILRARGDLADTTALRDAELARDNPDTRWVRTYNASIVKYTNEVAVREQNLIPMVATVASACAAGYPVVESLTTADARWYQRSSRDDWADNP